MTFPKGILIYRASESGKITKEKKMKIKLSMRRGSRTVVIGAFPNMYRAQVVASLLDWNPSWKPLFETL